MQKANQYILLSLVGASLLLMGCTDASNAPGNPSQQQAIQPGSAQNPGRQPEGSNTGAGGYRGRGQGFDNLTDAQREEMFQQRLQLAISASQGKNENDSCIMQGLGRNSSLEINGTCRPTNSTIACTGLPDSRQRFGNATNNGAYNATRPTYNPYGK